MASKRKYNPNKVSQLIQSKSMQVHRLWMRYDNDLIDQITDEWLQSNPDEDVATSLLYPHIDGDLIIAIKHRLISLEQKWNIKLTLELDDGTEAELIFDLPKAHLKDIKLPTAEFKIDRGNGIKTRWKGLDKEVEDALKPLEAEGVGCVRTWAYIAVETPFKSKADYSYFVQEKALRLMLGEMVAA